jgi:pantoate--beta-alanine ligase
MRRVTTIADMRRAVAAAKAHGQRVGLVPTMGFLHRGHLSLVEQCHDHADLVVVSVFVNPAQFAPGEDLDAYPRDLEGDETKLAALGDRAPHLVFAPDVAEVYPRERLTTVSVRGLNHVLCGRSRPTHFDGVTTVVAKLFNIVAPDVAVFGRKDHQQLTIIRRMAEDLDQPVEVLGGAIVREPDGVAMSSRNVYLEGDERIAARALSGALRRAVAVAREARAGGTQPTAGMLRDAAGVTLSAEPRVRTDYVEVLDPGSLTPPDQRGEGVGGDGTAPRPDASAAPANLLVAVAAYVGAARLIDNVVIGDAADEERLLAATSDEL